MCGFQALEFLHEEIEVGVGDFRGIQNVVKVLVAANLVAELFNFVLNVFGGGGHGEIIFRQA
jgi:hypothetical protein